MATFGITPVAGYPVPPSDSFPQFIQFQQDGVDLGAADVDTVDISTGLTATRGTGENSGTVTLLGDSARMSWETITASPYTLVLTDAGKGLEMSSASLVVPLESSVAFEDGTSILIADTGAGSPITITGAGGVTIKKRSVFTAVTAGENAIVMLIKRTGDTWYLTGDLATA